MKRRWSEPAGRLPTIGDSKAQGLTGLWVVCGNLACHRADVAMGWDQVGLPDDVPFVEIAARKRFVCQDCGGRGWVTPDWRAYCTRPRGMWIKDGYVTD